jgi:hypothetical protein
MQQAWLVLAFQLLAQLFHIDFNHIGVAAEVVAPHPVKQHLLGEYLQRVFQEGLEQLEFEAGQGDVALAAPDGMAAGVEGQISEGQYRRVFGLLPAQQRPHPREQHIEGERFDNVVVGACLQAIHLIGRRILGGEHNHGRAGADQPRAAAATLPGH